MIERVEVDFSAGLNVITGETGAGKSVLMGAIALALGSRHDASMVREGAREAEVEARFVTGGEGSDRRETVIRRTVTAQGRSRAWVNDESVSIAELKTLASGLVDIHGPMANRQILSEAFQRSSLDSFGSVRTAKYRAAYERYAEVRDSLARVRSEVPDEDEIDLLRYQVSEIEGAGLTGDDEDLESRHAAAAHAADIFDCANAITESLGGDGGVADSLARLQPKFAAAARHFPAAREWADAAEEITVRIQELSRTIAESASKIEANPAELEELDRRLALVNRLKRKYGDPLAKLAEKKARLDELERRDELLAELEKSYGKLRAEVEREGASLTAARKKAATGISKRITGELRELGFREARFSVRLEAIEPEASGCDRVTYMFEPNPGESERPLADIASSGEVARVMLAVKDTIVEHDGVESVIFDEIDANIGGETGAAVGAKMRKVSEGRQVIAITHLPQSAVYGNAHLVVSKTVSGGRTRTSVARVEGRERISEIARMLGGENITTVVRKHAKELLAIPS